jgi:CHRD domain
MKRLSLLFALGVFVSGCGSSSTAPTTPTNPTFVATLSPANEVPAITGAEASGSGTSTITMVTTKDSAGNVTAATMTFVVNMTGFPPGTSINAAHIHNAPAGQNSGVVVPSGITPGANVLTNGSGSFTTANLTVSPDLANQILANPAGFYFNIHSALNAGGVARGQLVRTQ